MASTHELLSDPTSVGVWNIDPNRSTIGFRAKSMWGIAPVKGQFTEFNGDGQITDTQTIFGRIDIHAASLDTKIAKRDKHLRSAEYFDSAKFPDISVVVTGAETIEGDSVELRAQLTVKGTTAPLPLRAMVARVDDDAVRLSAHTTIDRKDFGVDGNMMGMLTDNVTISGDVVFRRAG
jgi:polyisoprenoid-binding protein YceI